MNVFAVLNQKGGVGKTTTVANLGAALAARGHEVCVIDLDPQAHLTLHFGVEPGSTDSSLYHVLTGDAELSAATRQVGPHLHLVPSEIDMAAAEIELASAVGREQILRDRLAADPHPYAYVLIDCPPSLGLLTLNALTASRDVLIPLQPHFLALQGLGKLLETVSLVHRRINPALRVSGVVLCMYESGTRLAGEVLGDLQTFFEAARGRNLPWARTRIFQTVIRRNIKLAESPSHGKTIFDYQPGSHGAEDYMALAEEFLAAFPPESEAPADAAVAAANSPAVSVAAPSDEGDTGASGGEASDEQVETAALDAPPPPEPSPPPAPQEAAEPL